MPKTGGRKRGSRNRNSLAQDDLLRAWDKVSGPETAVEMMRKAVEMAKAGDFEPFGKLLPYIARKMPDTLELEGESVVSHMILNFPPEQPK